MNKKKGTKKLGADIVSSKEASVIIGVTDQTIRNWGDKGRLEYYEIPGGTRLYDREDILKIKKELKPLKEGK